MTQEVKKRVARPLKKSSTSSGSGVTVQSVAAPAHEPVSVPAPMFPELVDAHKLLCKLLDLQADIQKAQSAYSLVTINQKIDDARLAELKEEEAQLAKEVAEKEGRMAINRKLTLAYEKKAAKLDAQILELDPNGTFEETADAAGGAVAASGDTSGPMDT